MTVANFLQLSPARSKLIFSQFSDKHDLKNLLGLQLWHLFKYAELSEVARQNNYLFIDFLNIARIGNIDDDVEKFLKSRFIRESA